MDTPLNRREMLTLGVPAAAAMLPSTTATAATQPIDAHLGKNWPARRSEIARAWMDLLGEGPREIPPLKAVMKEVASEGGVTRYHVSLQAEPDDRVTAWLLVPDSARRKPTPAIICIHSTTWGAGKDSPAGLAGRRKQDPPTHPDLGRAAGLELARHGYVTLCPDMLTDGERIPPGGRVMDTRWFYRKHPEWSIIGKNNWDISRCIDFLQTLEFVDGKHIGCTGWSLGGHQTVFAAAFDERITAAAPNGGVLDWHRTVDSWSRKPASWEPWKEGDPPTNSPELERRMGFKTNSGPYIYIRKFRPWIDDPKKPLTTDFDELMMLVAPRPMLVISSEYEFYTHRLIPKCIEVAKVYGAWRDAPGLPSVVKARQERMGWEKTVEYYDFHHKVEEAKLPRLLSTIGAGDAFSWFSFPGGHAYPPVARRLSFAWFDRWLGHEPEAAGE